ncbi:6464_t:CDS:2, partial [Ambispora gerdemannii]
CNELRELDLTDQRESLTHLHVGDNNFPKQEEIYNKFNGSLEPLKNMNKLSTLHIENTNINSGLEYLPESINHFGYGDAADAVRQETKGSNKFEEAKRKVDNKKD